MRFPIALLFSLFSAMSCPALAETVKTGIGDLTIPDGLAILSQDQKLDPATEEPSGIIVFGKAGDLPRAVFIITYVHAAPGGEPFDALDTAVKIGNPFDPSLTAKDAKPVKVGGISGGRFDGQLPNGLRAVSYAVDNNSYRLIVLLKGPAQNPYKRLTDDFAKAVEGFVWQLPTTTAPASPTAAPAIEPAAAKTSDG